MELFKSHAELDSFIRSADIDTSFAVSFIYGAVDIPALLAVRNAERLCDSVVVVNLGEPLTQVQHGLFERAGASSFCELGMSSDYPCRLDIGLKGFDGTVMLQTLMTVMPLTVTTPENNNLLIRALMNIQKTFGEFFTVEIKPTPVHLLSTAHKKVREALEPVLYNTVDTSIEVDAFKGACKSSLIKNGLDVVSIQVLDGDSMVESYGVLSPSSMLLVEARHNGHTVKDILSLSGH